MLFYCLLCFVVLLCSAPTVGATWALWVIYPRGQCGQRIHLELYRQLQQMYLLDG